MAQINKPSEYFNTVLWTTDGTGNKALTTGHSTDMVWIKFRDFAYDHRIYDDVRGVTKKIIPNKTDAESTTTDLASFDANGFTVGNNLNTSGEGGLVGWSWKANGAGVSNTDGSITSTVSANTTSGFSIVQWTGTGSNATVGHGLGKEVKFFITKRTDFSGDNWYAYHSSLGGTKYLHPNKTEAAGTSISPFNNTNPTSTTISAGTDLSVSSSTHIAYCFAEKKGFSKFGSYTGNGSTDGTFIYTGFKPAFIITKKTSATSNWHIYDNQRANPFNVVSGKLVANTDEAEAVGAECDFLSNGVKIRASGSDLNGSGASFIYMAFAENPLVSTAGVPCTAR